VLGVGATGQRGERGRPIGIEDGPVERLGGGQGAIGGGERDGIGAGALRGQHAADDAGGGAHGERGRQAGGGAGERVAIGVGRGRGHIYAGVLGDTLVGGGGEEGGPIHVGDRPAEGLGTRQRAVGDGDGHGVRSRARVAQRPPNAPRRRVDREPRRQTGGTV